MNLQSTSLGEIAWWWSMKNSAKSSSSLFSLFFGHSCFESIRKVSQEKCETGSLKLWDEGRCERRTVERYTRTFFKGFVWSQIVHSALEKVSNDHCLEQTCHMDRENHSKVLPWNRFKTSRTGTWSSSWHKNSIY